MENQTQNEDLQVWQILFDRQCEILKDTADPSFFKGIQDIGFVREKVPVFDELSQTLRQTTGWEVFPVPGIVPNRQFFELLEQRKFCTTNWIRKMKDLDYLEEPDFFHDVFGHLPLLTNPFFAGFLEKLGEISSRFITDPEMVEYLSRFYWFTVEFGLIDTPEGIRIYGAGILSSRGETAYCLGPIPERRPFSVKQVLDTPYIKEKYQEVYYVIEDYEQLKDCLDHLEEELVLKQNEIRKGM